MPLVFSVFPLIFALLPALCETLLGNPLDCVVADTILLIIVAYALYKLSNISWYFYVDASNEYHRMNVELSKVLRSDEHMMKLVTYGLSLVIYLSTPIIGAFILLQARKWLFTGSNIANNINIVIYLGIGWIIITNSISVNGSKCQYPQRVKNNLRTNYHDETNEFDSCVIKLSALKNELGSLETKLADLNKATQGQIFTAWKAADKISHIMTSNSLDLIQKHHTSKPTSKYVLDVKPADSLQHSHALIESSQYQSNILLLVKKLKLWCKLLITCNESEKKFLDNRPFNHPSTLLVNRDTKF